MKPAFHVVKMLGATLGSLVILSLVIRTGAPENRLFLFGAIGVIVLSSTAIWASMGNQAVISRRAWQMLAWGGMLILFAVFQMRGRPQSQIPDRQEVIGEFVIPLAIVILVAIVAGSVAGRLVRHKRQQNSPGPDNGRAPSLR